MVPEVQLFFVFLRAALSEGCHVKCEEVLRATDPFLRSSAHKKASLRLSAVARPFFNRLALIPT